MTIFFFFQKSNLGRMEYAIYIVTQNFMNISRTSCYISLLTICLSFCQQNQALLIFYTKQQKQLSHFNIPIDSKDGTNRLVHLNIRKREYPKSI